MQPHSESTITGKRRVPVATLIPWLEKQGQALFGEHFRIEADDHALLGRLLVYFLGDREEAAAAGLNLRKGILLMGPVGCGKTSWMTLLRLVLPFTERYRVLSCRQVSFAFQQEGFEVIQRYSCGDTRRPGYRPLVYAFDDLGTEQVQRHYGTTCQVMGEVLLSRYDLYVSSGLKTHLTTNLTSAEIEAVYGQRVRSRMREMFNLVSFPSQAKDKRA